MNNRKIITVSLFFILLTSLIITTKATADKDKNIFLPDYPFDSLYIKYKLEGLEKGEEELYIKGNKQAKYSKNETNIMGKVSRDDTLEIRDPDYIIKVDFTNKTAKKWDNQTKYMQEEYSKLTSKEKKIVEKNLKDFGSTFMGALTGEPKINKKKGTILEKPCTIVETMGIETYTWEDTNIPLKVKGDPAKGFDISVNAIELKENIKIDDKKLEVPKGYNIIYDQQASARAERIGKRFVNLLKNPKMAEEINKATTRGRSNPIQVQQVQEQDKITPKPVRIPPPIPKQSGENQPRKDIDSTLGLMKKIQNTMQDPAE